MTRVCAKSVAEMVLARAGVARLGRRLAPPERLILAYHNILPDGVDVEGDASLHLPRSRFAEQLNLLTGRCEVVPLDRLLDDESARSGRRPRVAITFDDAYCGAVTVGIEELARRGLPTTIFVAPAFVGGRAFWWDALAAAGALTGAVRRHALEELDGTDSAVRRWAQQRGLRLGAPGAFVRTATERDLRAATRHPGITLASHSWSHPNLSRLRPEAVEAELGRSWNWLRERFDRGLPWLSYPYGLSTPEVERIAERLGYRGALRIDGGGWRRHPENRYALPRLNIPAGLSANGFELRLAGWFDR